MISEFTSRFARLGLCLLLLGSGQAGISATVAAAELKPYVARYQVKYRGLSGGEIEFKLQRLDASRYVFSSQLLPNFLGGLFASEEAQDRSEFVWSGEVIQPQLFVSEDGTRKTDKDQRYEFDWPKARALGHWRDRDFTLAISPGVQDRLSIQLAASLALQAGREPGRLVMIERDELQEYHITIQGNERLKTALGELETVRLKSERTGSDRVTQYWYAATLGYLPVRAQRLTKGKVDIVMELSSFRSE